MAEKIPAPNGIPEHATLCSSFHLYETSEEEVVRLKGNLSDGKAINENDIPTKIIKLAKFVLAPILTRIFNKCINEGFYPDCLQVAEVIPIYKSGEQNICSNYRLISILLQFNKIFERILYDKVYFYLQEYKLLSKYQFGFRPRSSTSYAVESIYSNLLSKADNGLHSCSIFLDLSEAVFLNLFYSIAPFSLSTRHFRSPSLIKASKGS